VLNTTSSSYIICMYVLFSKFQKERRIYTCWSDHIYIFILITKAMYTVHMLIPSLFSTLSGGGH
jgi:hypothetical protein